MNWSRLNQKLEGTEVPLLGYVAAGRPIQAVAIDEVISVPADMVKTKGKTYVLQVRGNSMIDEQIRDGDYVMVEDRKTAENGEMVIALIDGDEATLKKFYRERGGNIRLQPANPEMKPMTYPSDRHHNSGDCNRDPQEILRSRGVATNSVFLSIILLHKVVF